jgi:hypothetical protein
MTQATDLTQVIEHRITQIVDQLQKEHPFLQDLDRTQQIREHTDELLEHWGIQQLADFSEERLSKIVRNLMVLDACAGALNDLTPEQMEQFDEAVKRGN